MSRTKIDKWIMYEKKMKAQRDQHKIELKDHSGIYAIVNIMNNHRYVGQTMSISERWRKHLYDLKNNRHGNAYLQNAWNQYKEPSFKFMVLEYCHWEELSEKEQYWIDYLRPEYNIIIDILHSGPIPKDARLIVANDLYQKPGETFYRPEWHKWVYGGERDPQR